MYLMGWVVSVYPSADTTHNGSSTHVFVAPLSLIHIAHSHDTSMCQPTNLQAQPLATLCPTRIFYCTREIATVWDVDASTCLAVSAAKRMWTNGEGKSTLGGSLHCQGETVRAQYVTPTQLRLTNMQMGQQFDVDLESRDKPSLEWTVCKTPKAIDQLDDHPLSHVKLPDEGKLNTLCLRQGTSIGPDASPLTCQYIPRVDTLTFIDWVTYVHPPPEVLDPAAVLPTLPAIALKVDINMSLATALYVYTAVTGEVHRDILPIVGGRVSDCSIRLLHDQRVVLSLDHAFKRSLYIYTTQDLLALRGPSQVITHAYLGTETPMVVAEIPTSAEDQQLAHMYLATTPLPQPLCAMVVAYLTVLPASYLSYN